MKTNWIIAATMAGCIGASAISSAQSNSTIGDTYPTGFAVRIGVPYALDINLRGVSSFWYGLGVDYYPQMSLLKNATFYISGDAILRAGNGGGGNIFPVCANLKFPLTSKVRGYGAYAFAGAGAFITNIGSSNTVLGARGGFGVDLGPNTFAEAVGTISEPIQGIRVSTIGLYVGYRF